MHDRFRQAFQISIHALREEGDATAQVNAIKLQISIHALREEGDATAQVNAIKLQISIHALREEGDILISGLLSLTCRFLSTPSARRATRKSEPPYHRKPISIHALREEGDSGAVTLVGVLIAFLSTPSARRATMIAGVPLRGVRDFYPRPPRGGRQQKQRENPLRLSHYTPLCTNCKEMSANQTAKSHRYLRKRLVFRCEASRKTMCAADSHWPDIKRATRCLGQILGAVQPARPWSGSCCPAGRTADCPRQGRSGRSALL